MSALQPALKEVSSSPSKRAVVDPTNRDAQAADVDRKLRLYGVIQAFREGRLPSNAQIEETLQYVLDHSPVSVEKLSPDGKKLVQDVRDVIKTAGLMVQDKNADELFQNFIWHTQGVDTDHIKNTTLNDALDNAPVDKTKAKEDGDQAVKHLRTLFTLVLSNSEVRKLFSDLSLIGRDLLSIGASKAAELIAPEPHKLSQVDQTAPNDQFITEGGRTAGPNETPVLQQDVPFTDHKLRMHPKEDTQPMLHTAGGEVKPAGSMAAQGFQAYHDVRQQGVGFAKEAATGRQQEDVSDDTRNLAGGLVQQSAEAAARAKREGEEYGELDSQGLTDEKEAKKAGVMGKVRQLRDNIKDGFSERVPEEHRDRLNEHAEGTKKFFSEEYFPEERRDQFIFRLKKVVIECQKHDDYQASIRWLLDYLEEYARHGKTTTTNLQEATNNNASDLHHHKLKLAMLELRTLLERFASGLSMDIIFDAINVLIDDGRRDPELRHWFHSVDSYVRKVLLEPGFILEPECDTHATRLRESGRGFYDDKYKAHFDNLFDSTSRWFKAMGDDPLNQRFGNDWARLTRDLLFDSEGSLKFKPELWNDIRRIILPQLIQQVGYIPIPRIEYTDDALDLVVENLTLQGRNLFPNIIEMEAENYLKFSPYDAITDDSRHKISFTLSQIQADMRDVAFYYRKKTGLPRMKDSGIADVLIGGEGLSAHVTLVATKKDTSSLFKVQNVTVKVDSLKFSIRDSKHDFLYKTLRPLAMGLVKKQIQKALRDAIVTGLEYVDGQLVGVRERMEVAKATEGQRRAEVLQSLFARTKSPESSTTASVNSHGGASVVSGHSQFKIVSNKRDSLLSEVGNPAGWANRTAEKDEKAKTGQDWKSEAFSIVRN